MALRSMSPEIIAVDELGGRADAKAVEEMILCGCGILGWGHGDTMEHLTNMAEIGQMYQKKLIQRYVFLKKREDGERIFYVYDKDGRQLC